MEGQHRYKEMTEVIPKLAKKHIQNSLSLLPEAISSCEAFVTRVAGFEKSYLVHVSYVKFGKTKYLTLIYSYDEEKGRWIYPSQNEVIEMDKGDSSS